MSLCHAMMLGLFVFGDTLVFAEADTRTYPRSFREKKEHTQDGAGMIVLKGDQKCH